MNSEISPAVPARLTLDPRDSRNEYAMANLQDKVFNEDARQATVAEHSLTLWQALKTYKKAAFWSIRMCIHECALRREAGPWADNVPSHQHDCHHGRL